MSDPNSVRQQILTEQYQLHEARKPLFAKLEAALERPVVTLFTSFNRPVILEDSDATLLEGFLQTQDLTKGLALLISSPGGDGLAAERIVNICRTYSRTGEYWAIVPGKAKSAATMICFGASRILMGPVAELGPVDPQWQIVEDGQPKRFSVFNIIESYDDLFARATSAQGRLEPFLQQLARYDEREIKEHRTAVLLAKDIAVRSLATGMMKGTSPEDIEKQIAVFLSPEKTKSHGRPIYFDEALACGLAVESIPADNAIWQLVYELYVRMDNYVTTFWNKCIESSRDSFVV